MASRVETAAQGSERGAARPLAAAIPILTPVNEPGPAVTAIPSISLIFRSACESTFSIIGISVCEWVSFTFAKAEEMTSRFSVTAAEAGPAEHSIESIFILVPRC